MELYTFKPPFETEEFNKFCRENIIYKYNFLPDGTVQLFYKKATSIGNQPIELIETLDRLVKKAEEDNLATSLDLEDKESELADLKEEKSKVDPEDGKAFSIVQNKIQSCETQIAMHKETMEVKNRQIMVFRSRHQTLLNKGL